MASFLTIRRIWSFKALVIPVMSVLLFLPIMYSVSDEDIPPKARKCLYVMCVMAICWVTEAVPISVTALFPLVMFPLAGVLSAKDAASVYVTDTSLLFLGGLIVAVAVEEWDLHKRIAVGVMLLVGSDAKWVMAGLMLPTWFLSMWISNTATASMMIPIAAAVLEQMRPAVVSDPENFHDVVASSGNENHGYDGEETVIEQETRRDSNQNSKHTVKSLPYVKQGVSKKTSLEITESEIRRTGDDEEDSNYIRKCKGLTLCIAYAANIGGVGTITGTPPNIVFRGEADSIYNRYQYPNETQDGSPVSFANWMGMAVPLSLITLVVGWLLLIIFFLTGKGCCTADPDQQARIKKVIRAEWKKLGRLTFAEGMMIVLFILLAAMWLSRDPKETDGWAAWFTKNYPSDATSAMLVACLLFILPAKLPYFSCCRSCRTSSGDPMERFYTPLLTWQRVQEKLPWGVILLLGGGFSLAKGVRESGLADWLVEKLESFDFLDTWVLNLVICLIVATFTEVTSNTATAQILMPIVSRLAISLEVSPLYLMSSSCIATSFAFMLPVATPPNAIVFSYGRLRVIDMTIVGFFMNILAVGCLTLCVNTWGDAIYDFDFMDPRFHRNLTLTQRV